MIKKPLSIYFHWPYCKSKCPYCDFFKKVQKNVPQQQIIDSYCQELEYYQKLLPERIIRSVFFGGGTPSLIEPKLIGRLLDKISGLWPLEKNIEISLEANPNSEYKNMFANLRSAGINRLSLGVQALDEQDLRFLGRTHNLTQARHCLEEVIKHFDNHSADLIYARPAQNVKDWEKELEDILSYGLKHLSLYQLTIEEGTVFWRKNIRPADESLAAELYQFTVDYLRSHGYPRYEVSNYAPQKYESSHNKCYWQGDDYIGIGESAHGRLKIDSNHYALCHPHIFEKLSPAERAEELIIMGLRLQSGIDKEHFRQICGLEFDSFINQTAAKRLISDGFAIEDNHTFAATDKGFLVLDKIIEELCS